MKVAIFTDSYTPNIDGVVSSILAYKGGVEKLGHKYYVFAPDAPGAKPEPDVYRYHAIKFPPYPQYRAAVFPYVSAEIAKKNRRAVGALQGNGEHGSCCLFLCLARKTPFHGVIGNHDT